MNKLLKNKNLIYIILLVIGIIAIFTFAISTFISIWFGDDTSKDPNTQIEEELNYDDTNPTSKVGTYNTVSWNVKKQVNYYARWICDALQTKNVKRINELISAEYKEHFGLNDEKLIKLLETKGMWGKTINMDKYEYVTYGDNKVFKLHIYSQDKTVDDYINLIEYSPKKVAISFDNFITANKKPKEYIRDNVKYTFSNEIIFDTRYKVNLKITNNSDSDVILNKTKDYENMYLNFTSLTSEKVISTVFAGETITLKPNTEFNTILEFNIQDLSFSKIKGVTFEKITFTKNDITKDVEIEF